MVRSKSRWGAQQRGLTMIIALVVVAVLLFVAVVLLSNAFGSVATESSIRAKIAAFDAAEAGINQALEVLDEEHGLSADCVTSSAPRTTGRLADGGRYEWCIAYNGVVNGANDHVADVEPGHAPIRVPDRTVYAWSRGRAGDAGRGVLIEALIAPSVGLPLPSGAIDAAGDVYSRSDVSIFDNGVSTNDASIRANGSIYETVAPRIIQGNTYATGVDQIHGRNGTNANAPAMAFPTPDQLAGAAQNAAAEARASATFTVPPNDSTVIIGSAFIDGDVDLQRGSVLFQHGRSVYINGDLCIHPGGSVVNDGSVIWVNGTVSTAGSGSAYTVVNGSHAMLIALGTDDGRLCGNSTGKYSVEFDSSTKQRIGFVYAPYGSIDLSGTGVLVGAIDAGRNVYLDSTQGGGLQFDPDAVAPVPTYDFKIVSYMEY